MLPSSCRLSYLISRWIQIKLLNLEVEAFPYQTDLNLEENLAPDDPYTLVFHGYYNGSHLSDGFYYVEAEMDPTLEIMPNCMLRINFWTMRYEKSKLILTVIKASIQPTLVFSLFEPMVPIEDNFMVSELLQTYKYLCIIQSLENPIEELYSESSQNSALEIENLKKLLKEEDPATQDSFPLQPLQTCPNSICKSLISFEPEQKYFPDQILEESPQDKKPTEPSSHSSSESELEVFPDWSLTYLKFYYKI